MSRVLILADDADLSEDLCQAVAEDVDDVTKARSVSEGRQQLSEEPPQLLVMDGKIREADTKDELPSLFEICRSADIPIIVVGDDPREGDDFDMIIFDCVAAPPQHDELRQRKQLFLQLKERLDQLRSQAVIDQLTGRYNRRYLEEQLAIRWEEAKRYETALSLVLFDLDHFKNVNDTLGHPFGDAVLRQTADLVQQQVRKEDVLARYGGEEFAMILPHTDRLGAAILAERVRETVAENECVSGDRSVVVTISVGVVSLPIDKVTTVEDFVELTDRRMYQAKKEGRNLTVFE